MLLGSVLIAGILSSVCVHYLQYCAQLQPDFALEAQLGNVLRLSIGRVHSLLAASVTSTVADVIQWMVACCMLRSLLKKRINKELSRVIDKTTSPTSEQMFGLASLNQWNPLNSPIGVVYLFISLICSTALRSVLASVIDSWVLPVSSLLQTTLVYLFAEMTGSIITSAVIFSFHQTWVDISRAQNELNPSPEYIDFGSRGWYRVVENLVCLGLVYYINAYLSKFLEAWVQENLVWLPVLSFFIILWPVLRLGNSGTSIVLLLIFIMNCNKVCIGGSLRVMSATKEVKWIILVYQAINICLCYCALLLSSSTRQVIELENGLQRVVHNKHTQLHQTIDDLVHSSSVKSQFLSTVSHELRTPMNGVIGMAELLQLTTLSNEQKQYVDDILSSSHHLLGIVDDILDFDKLQNEKVKLRVSSTQITSVIRQAILLARHQKYNHLSITYKVDANVPLWLMVDATRLKQILVNVLGNALKFTDVGGVSITATIVSISDQEQTEYRKKIQQQQPTVSVNTNSDEPLEHMQIVKIKFSVADTGIGINPDQFSNLFHSFGQLNTSSTRERGGTGLGLVICQRLVDLMNGSIWLESQPTQGTTFYFTIIAFVPSFASGASLATGGDVANTMPTLQHDVVQPHQATEASSTSSQKSSLPLNLRVEVMIAHPNIDTLQAFQQYQHEHINILFSTSIYSEAQNYIRKLYPLPADICIFDFTYAGADLIYEVLKRWEKANPHMFNPSVSDSSAQPGPIPMLVLFCSHSHMYAQTPGVQETNLETDEKSLSLKIDCTKWGNQRQLIFSLLSSGLLHVVHQPIVFSAIFDQLAHDYNMYWLRRRHDTSYSQLVEIIKQLVASRDPAREQETHPLTSSPPPTESRSTVTCTAAKNGDDPHILVVEDNIVNQKVLISMLKRLLNDENPIPLATNGQQAVDMVRQALGKENKFDIILMDIQMPVMGGIEAAREIFKIYETARLPPPIMVAVTANLMPSNKELYLSSGFVDCVSKPYSIDTLRTVLDKYKKSKT